MFRCLGNSFIYFDETKNRQPWFSTPALDSRRRSLQRIIVSCSSYFPAVFQERLRQFEVVFSWHFAESEESWQQAVHPINNQDQSLGGLAARVGGAPDKLHMAAGGGEGGGGTHCAREHKHTHTPRRSRTPPTFLQFACGALFITLYFQESQVELGFWLSVCR